MKRKLFSIGLVCLIALFFVPHFVHAQEKINGPWLWMIAPTVPGQGGAASINIDSLAVASSGAVTEADVAANGANEGDKVGNFEWTLGTIDPFVDDSNINECLNRIGLADGPVNDHSCYALFTVKCETAWRDVTMRIYTEDVIKVWLNGKVVYMDKIFYVNGHGPFLDRSDFQVDFVAGNNLLMIKVCEFFRDDYWDMGVTMEPSQLSQQEQRPIVRLVYFLPRDRQPQPDIDAKLDKSIKDAQQLYADQMEHHGYGRKTFQIETDLNGKTVVHHIVGQFTDAHYGNLPNTTSGIWSAVWSEIDENSNRFDWFKYHSDYYLAVVDFADDIVPRGGGGGALVHVSNKLGTIVHELGHAFGLSHDFRGGRYIMSYSGREDGLSKCAAEALNVHRAFNTAQPVFKDQPATIKMLPPRLAAPSNAIRFSFEVTDLDGLYHASLYTNETEPRGFGGGLLGCKLLNGQSSTVEFVIDQLTLGNKFVYLYVIDVHGNIAASQTFPIDMTTLLPPAKVVSIPDANLASAVRQALNLSSSQVLTTHTMLDLKRLDAGRIGITDLTGLEHAHNLRDLSLAYNNISDISPLTNLKQLRDLSLDHQHNNLSDMSPLTSLTQLRDLDLAYNNISDISPLTNLKQLRYLRLWDNNISDVSPLAGLTKLVTLRLGHNSISDVSPLLALNLTGTEWASTGLELQQNPLSYTSINTHIPAMQAKGIDVVYDNVAHPALYIVSGNEQEDFAGSVLSSPLVVEAQDENGEPMAGVSVTFTVETGNGQLTAPTATTDADGRAQTHLMLGWTPGRNTVRASGEGIESWAIFSAIGIKQTIQITEDVNRDGVVDVEDLVLVAATLGTTPPKDAIPQTDVNGDGVVNNDDLALVMAALETTPTAPASVWTAANLRRWIDEAKQRTNRDEIFLQGIAVLEQLLASMLPKKTALLANYPNPSNPETWIPYHLAKPAEVTLRIYAVNGVLVRALVLGHQAAGIYLNRSRAAYWDGRNAQGESVASGVYFYTLTAGDFSATRKMLIMK